MLQNVRHGETAKGVTGFKGLANAVKIIIFHFQVFPPPSSPFDIYSKKRTFPLMTIFTVSMRLLIPRRKFQTFKKEREKIL